MIRFLLNIPEELHRLLRERAMATWTGVITNAGNDLLNGWVGEKKLSFEYAKAGTGTVPVASLMAQTNLVSPKQDASILNAEDVSEGIRLKLRITAPQEEYSLKQFGLWASVDGKTSLIAIFQNENGISIPSISETPDFVFTFYALILTSNKGSWTVNIDTTALVNAGDMTQAIADAVSKYLPLDGTVAMDADFPMGGNKITGLAAPTSNNDAARKADVDEVAENALPKSGGTMTGAISMDGHTVTGLPTPADNADAAPKSYVDDRVQPVNKGGTGATDGSSGLKNLLAAGKTVLSANQYGTALPAAGTPGRIFFKKV